MALLGTLIVQRFTIRPLIALLRIEPDRSLDSEVAEARSAMLDAALGELAGYSGEIVDAAAASLAPSYQYAMPIERTGVCNVCRPRYVGFRAPRAAIDASQPTPPVTRIDSLAARGCPPKKATVVSPMGIGYAGTPGIWSAQQVEGWKLTTRAVHEAGGRIFLQLWHVGRLSDTSFLNGALPVAPSAVAAKGNVSLVLPQTPFVTPRALAAAEVRAAIAAQRAAARGVLRRRRARLYRLSGSFANASKS